MHSLTEGLTLSSTIRLTYDGSVSAASLGVFLAIALHKPLDALSIVSTMRANGVRRTARRAANWGFALLFPIAVFGTYWGAAQIGSSEMTVIGCALAFATGAFLCIALSDLLPEIHFHGHDRLKTRAQFPDWHRHRLRGSTGWSQERFTGFPTHTDHSGMLFVKCFRETVAAFDPKGPHSISFRLESANQAR